MMTQQTVIQFARNLQQQIPFVENMQIMTSDGLTLHNDKPMHNEDTVSALTAMLYSAARNLANYLDANLPQGMIICMGDNYYAIARVNDDCVMGFHVPAQMSTPQALQAVCDFIDANEHQLRITH
jgi:predicted regulator of Ras-like GTPase activity (Roadblock/LC7/MglB family)